MTRLPDPNSPPASPYAVPGSAALRARRADLDFFPVLSVPPSGAARTCKLSWGKGGVPRPPLGPQPHGVGIENLPVPSTKPFRHRSLMVVFAFHSCTERSVLSPYRKSLGTNPCFVSARGFFVIATTAFVLLLSKAACCGYFLTTEKLTWCRARAWRPVARKGCKLSSQGIKFLQ